jgi:hypothetical protein
MTLPIAPSPGLGIRVDTYALVNVDVFFARPDAEDGRWSPW